MQKDLDRVIEYMRKGERALGTVEFRDKFADVSIEHMIIEIQEEAETLQPASPGQAAQGSTQRLNIENKETSSLVRHFRSVDKVFRHLPLYQKKVRPWLKRKIDSKPCSVDGKALLQYEGMEFIQIAYQSILLREADEEAKINCLHAMMTGSITKAQLLQELVRSEEAQQWNVGVRGLGYPLFRDRTRRFFKSIPVVGYTLRFVQAVILLPRNLFRIQGSIASLTVSMYTAGNTFENINRHLSQSDQVLSTLTNGLGLTQNELNLTKTNLLEVQGDLGQTKARLDQVQAIAENSQVRITQIEDDREAKRNEKLNRLKKEKELIDLFYMRYNEEVMKDSREEVKARASVYLERLAAWSMGKDISQLSMIDLGCGTCEWVELLNENGYPMIGIDNNTQVVEKVRSLYPDIQIIEAEAGAYLAQLPNASMDLVSSFHMVEHMQTVHMIEFLSECQRVLKPGGMLIVETPNPQNILTSTYYFHLDITHHKPIPPEILEYLIKECGLKPIERLLLYPLNFIPYEYKPEDPIRDIVFRFNMEQSYSVLAVKE